MALHAPLSVPRGAGTLLSASAVAALFFALGSVSMVNFGVNTPIWFSTAVGVVWLLKHPSRAWPVLIGAIWSADTLAIHLFGSGPAAILAVADVGEAVAAAALIRRIGGPAVALSSVWGMVRLIAICLGVPAVTATWGAGFLFWFEGTPFVPSYFQWYGATSLGLLIACPALLVWLTPELRPRLEPAELRRTALLAAAFAVLAASILSLSSPPWLFVLFPALLLLVWSSGLAGASIGSLLLLVVGLAQTFAGARAIELLVYPATDPTTQVQGLQLYLAALALSSLPLAVVLGDQRRLSAELARVADARSEFLAAMSHEIRTPMTGVLGIVDLLESESTTPTQRQYLHSIRASGRHLLNIINDILDFSRIETGRIELEQIDFSLPVLLERLAAVLQPLARERGVLLNYKLAEGSPPVVKGDPTRLKQVLLNLAGNAIKFTPEGSVTVRVDYRKPDGADHYVFRFEVRDTGIGIPQNEQAELFSAFTQGDHSTSRRFGGSGLGLAISKRLVAVMGGEIGFESVEGEGSLFRFEVPLEPGDALRLPAPGHGSAAPVASRRILVAEDVELNRDIVRTVLERDGHQVTLAENGQEAFDLARAGAFDMILMDVHMPVLDGLEAARRIRALPPPAGNVPIVALTANVMVTEQAKCITAGMNGVLMKPIEWDRVRAAIEQLCPAPAPVETASVPAGTPEPPPFDDAVFDRLAAILPKPMLEPHLAALNVQVRRLAAMHPGADPAEVAELAHKLISQAGMLGLMRLSSAAAELERAAASGEQLDGALGRFQTAAPDPQLLADPASERRVRTRRTS